MSKKYLTIAAAAAFFAASQVAQAPLQKLSNPSPIERMVITDDFFGKYMKKAEAGIKRLERKVDMLSRYETDSFYDDDLDVLVARLMLGETENYRNIDKIAVAWVALNRTKAYSTDLKTEILRPYQFSCFNPGTDSEAFLKKPLDHSPLKYTQEFPQDLELAKNFLAGKYSDPTYGATHYYNPDIIHGIPLDFRGLKFIRKIGPHKFYK